MHQDISKLLQNNKLWASEKLAEDPEYFYRLAKQQKPKYLWIGCSDSRVPANQIIGLAPGEVFVHRNIANQVIHTDLNCISVMQYAIDFLNIEHIIVCGHYQCGGVMAALEGHRHGIVDHWIRGIRDLHDRNLEELSALKDEEQIVNRLCELNVATQVQNICFSPLIQVMWKQNKKLSVHGWIYSISDGLIRDLGISVSGSDEIPLTQKIL